MSHCGRLSTELDFLNFNGLDLLLLVPKRRPPRHLKTYKYKIYQTPLCLNGNWHWTPAPAGPPLVLQPDPEPPLPPPLPPLPNNFATLTVKLIQFGLFTRMKIIPIRIQLTLIRSIFAIGFTIIYPIFSNAWTITVAVI